METRTVNTTILIHVAVGHLTCKVTTHLLESIRNIVAIPMDISISQFYDERLLHNVAHLDLPTHEDPVICRQLSSDLSYSSGSVAWKAIEASTSLATSVIGVVFQLSVLFTVLREQQDGFLLMILGSSQHIFNWYNTQKARFRPSGRSTARVDVMNIHLSHT